uniref:Hpt protein n=1 Tax=Rhodopseudomonas palustris (strain BisA53) TaxID=316055 RepID=Q07RK9_RHOP5
MLEFERIAWMSSPSIVPDLVPIDFEHLERMTLGDEDLAREVLELFVTQADVLIGRLTALPKDAAALTHQLKGSARGIGAMAVAQAAENVEAVLREGGDVSLALWALDMAVKAAGEAIAQRLRQN